MAKPYQTARFTEGAIKEHGFTPQSGARVQVRRAHAAVHDSMSGGSEPIYYVYANQDDSSYIGMFYQRALTKFDS